MPTSESLRLRIRLIAEFEQLAERLAHGNETTVEEAQNRLYGAAMAANVDTLALIMKALATVPSQMQDEIDRGGLKF